MTKEENKEKIAFMRTLPYNWNDNGAQPINPTILDFVDDLIDQLIAQPFISPHCDGTAIQVEYECPNKAYLEFNIYPDIVRVFSIDSNRKENTYELPVDDLNINDVLYKFLDMR